MNIKNIKYSHQTWLVLLVLLVVSACGKEFKEVELIEPTHRIVYTSQGNNANTVNIGSLITFYDVSKGVSSRTWSHSNPELVTVDEGDDMSAKMACRWSQAGEYTVTLNQTFDGEVYLDRDTDQTHGSAADTTITITVLPLVEISTLTANVLAADGTLGQEISLSAAQPTEVYVGTTIRYSFTAIGNPDRLAGDFGVGATLLGQNMANGTFDIKYSGLDQVYDLQFILRRTNPGSADTSVVYNDIIKCVRSTVPVTLDKYVVRNGEIQLTYSRDMDPGSVKKNDFAVSIETSAGAKLNPGVGNAVVNADNPAMVILTLDGEQLYDDDKVTLTYSASGLQTTDAYPAEAFTNLELVQDPVNLLAEAGFDFSFESPDVSWVGNDVIGWLPGNNATSIEKTTEQAFDGESSLKVVMPACPGGLRWGLGTCVVPKVGTTLHSFPLAAGNYRLSYRVYLGENGGSTIDPDVNPPNGFYSNTRANMMGLAGTWSQSAPNGIGGGTEGTWIELSENKNIAADEDFHFILQIAQTMTEQMVIYYDRIVLSVPNDRP